MDTDTIKPIQRQYRTFYPDTQECIDTFAESLTEVYAEALKRPGTRGLIKVMTLRGWTDCLGFEIPNK